MSADKERERRALEAPTIAAIATPLGQGGISIVRMSGPAAFSAARVIGADLPGRPLPRRAYRSRFVSPEDGSVMDEGLILLFRAPASFTGEDVAELHGHGGVAQSRALLSAAVKAGCEPAGPGAFTRRAVLNGRMDLARAEGVAEIVAAETEAGLRAARSLLGGALSRRVEGMLDAVEEVLSECEAAIDFPDEAGGQDEPAWALRLQELAGETRELAGTWKASGLSRRGPRVVLVGPPNSGKSSLLNALAGYPRAIVDARPGTTRDLLEADVEILGRSVTLVDGAGVRRSRCKVESRGMEMLEEAARDADLLLGVLDASRPPGVEDERSIDLLLRLERPLLMLANKSDLGRAGLSGMEERGRGVPWLSVSAATGAGLAELSEAAAEALGRSGAGESEVVITLERHHRALVRAGRALDLAEAMILGDEGLEIACEELREARRELSEIVGRGALADSLLDKVFEKFCIGK